MIDVYLVESENGGDCRQFNKATVLELERMGVLAFTHTASPNATSKGLKVRYYRKA